MSRNRLFTALRACLVASLAALFASCGSGSTSPPIPQELTLVGKGLYQGDMDGHRGLLFLALHPSAMAVAYDTARCGLYLAWKGPVLGTDRDARGGYVPQGPLYQKQDSAHLWTVLVGGDTVTSTIRLQGFEEDAAGELTLHYILAAAGGRTIHIDESPAYFGHYGDHALDRTFRCEGLDSATTVRVRLGGPHPNWKGLWSVDISGDLDLTDGEEALTLSYDGTSIVRVTWEGSADN